MHTYMHVLYNLELNMLLIHVIKFLVSYVEIAINLSLLKANKC